MEGLLYPSKHHGDLIIMYHNVDLRGDSRFNLRFISRSDFRRQMVYLHREYTIVPLNEMFTKPNPGVRRLSVTFDDGLMNNFRHAAPILRHLSIPATFFCSASRAENKNLQWPDALNICTYYWSKPIEFEGVVFHPKPWNRYRSVDGLDLMNEMKGHSTEKKWQVIDNLKTQLGFDPFETVHYLKSAAMV
jgi:hypothetical protein